MVFFAGALLLAGLLWAKARDPFHREWLSLETPDGARFSAVAVMPDRGGPFPVVVWCHGSGGSLESSGETLRQLASVGVAAVGFEYDKTNQANFDAQFSALLDELAGKEWAARKSDSEPATFNHQPSTRIAWVGQSLGAQRQLSFLARHPERQPAALVRLNGGMVEEFRGKTESGKAGDNSTAEDAENADGPNHKSSIINHKSTAPSAAKVAGPHSPDIHSPDDAPISPEFATPENADGPNHNSSIINHKSTAPATFNLQPATSMAVWLAHGENDEVFPASDARKVADALRASGADVRLEIFPGRGHSFGEDQPLLVKAAAEFCARKLGGTPPRPDNVRPSYAYCWLPVGIIGAMWLLRRSRLQSGRVKPLRFPKLHLNASSRWLRFAAFTALIIAALVSAAHLLLPLFRPTPATLKLARHATLRPGLRADFDWLAQQPGSESRPLRDLLEHLNLASLQRTQFAPGLSDAQWREFVLSPWIEKGSEDLAWRRTLWEWMSPRVRRESDVESAARIVARELRLRVTPRPETTAQEAESIAAVWATGAASDVAFARLHVAALRSVGLPSRLNHNRAELLVANQWQPAPAPILDHAP